MTPCPCRCPVCQADRWAHRVVGFVAGLIVAYLLWGIVATIEASRSAQPTEVRVDVSAPSSSLDPSPVPVASDAAGAVVIPAERTPSPSARPSLVGLATWYDDGPGDYAAAGPRLRRGTWRNSHVVITGFHDGRSWPITVALTDWCQCYRGTPDERLIDLSPDVFLVVCGELWRGKCKVTVEVPR